MTKTKSTKRALLMSALALLMCVSMLIGSTFAWFTDSVTSAGNKIQAGTLDIELWKVNSMMAETEQVEDEALFDYDLWEPGYTYATDLKLKNVGTLDARFVMTIVPTEEVGELAEVIDVYYTINDFYAWKMATQWSDPSTLREAVKEEFVKLGTLKDVLNGTVKFPETALPAESDAYIQIAMAMQETAGNEYQGKSAGAFDLRILATQLTSEEDSFDDQYDKFADYDGEISNAVSLAAALKNGGTYKVTSDINVDETINIPAGVEVALNLNGKTIDYNAESGSIIRSEGDLTLAGEGKINSTARSYAIRAQSGSLTVDSNDIEIVGTFGAISMFNGAEVTVNGGSYTATGVAGNTHHCVFVGTGANLVINDGTFAHNGAGTSDSGATLTVMGGANGGATINGGTFTGSGTYIKAFAKYDSDCYFTINGGTFTTDPSAYVAEGYVAVANSDNTYTVMKGVAVNNVTALTEAIANGEDTVVLAAGNYTMPQDSSFTGKTFTIAGTKDTVIDISAIPTNGSQAFTGATMVFDGVTVTCATVNYKGFTHAANLTYKNCQINGLQFLFAEDVTFENCDFNSNGAEHSVWTYGAKNITFTDCDFTYADRAVNVYLDNGTGSVDVSFNGCTFTTDNTASKGAVEINSSAFPQGANVSFVDCTAPAYGTMVGISGWDSANGANATVTVDGSAFTATQWAK